MTQILSFMACWCASPMPLIGWVKWARCIKSPVRSFLFLVRMLLVAMPGAPSSVLAPRAPSSFLFLVGASNLIPLSVFYLESPRVLCEEETNSHVHIKRSSKT